MALTVATNTGALMAQAAASSVNKEMEVSMERLSSGKRINSASDDAAGVAIASRLTAEIRGTNMAIRNALDGQALIDTAEGAHIEVENILQRMREVAVQAANDTNNSDDRANLQTEINALVTEIDRISNSTTWAGTKLLDGSDTNGLAFQIGSGTQSSDTVTTIISSTSAQNLGVGAKSLTEISSLTGGTFASTTGDLTFTAGAGATTIKIGDNLFSMRQDIAAGTGNILTTATAATDIVSLTVTSSTGTKDFTVNGVTVEYAGHATAATAAANLRTAFNSAKSTNADALGHLVATVTSGATVDFSSTANNKRDAMIALINQNTSVTNDFTLTSGSSKITFATKNPVATTSVGTNTVTASGSAAITAGDGTLVVAADASGSASRFNTIEATVAGVTVSFNTNTDVIDKGYLQTSSSAVAQALIQKFEDAGLKSVTMTESAGTITFTQGGASDVTTKVNAEGTIERIDTALKSIATARAQLGSVSNRLDSTVSNLTNISSNLQAGRGRIEDADFAAETTTLAKTQILQQASTAMLAQANASKQNVLSLLQG